MNRIFLPAVLAFALSGTLAVAQAPDQTPATPPPAHAHTPNPSKQVAHLAKQLNLTPDQQAKLEPIFADHDQKLAALNASATPDKKQRHALEQDLHTQLAAVLTPDQLEQMKAMHHKGKGETQTIPPPPPPSV